MSNDIHADKTFLNKLLNGETVDSHFAGNPLGEAMQLHVEEISLQKIILKFTVSRMFTQGNGVIQGGIVSAMLDFGAAYIGLLNTLPNKGVVTTNLSINYLRAAPAGQYFVEAELDKAGSKMVFSSAKLYQQAGKNIATAIFSMAVV
jgi:uncharacterized protein (TIGR00369 family)